jgi:hypothetical protein
MESNNLPNSIEGKDVRKYQLFLFLILVLGIVLAIFFGTRVFQSGRLLHERKFGGGETNVELIRGWMTVEYIMKMYHVPPDVILEPMGVSTTIDFKQSLRSLIRSTGTADPEGMLEKIKHSIDAFQQKDVRPPPKGTTGLNK